MTTDEATAWLNANRPEYPWVVANLSGQTVIGLPCHDGVMLYQPANPIEKAADACIAVTGSARVS